MAKKKQSQKDTDRHISPETPQNHPTTPKKKVGVLYFIIPGNQHIDEEHVSLVRQSISKATVNKIYIAIDSTGGIPYSAVRIMRVLTKKFTEVYGIVPHQAMSAATLMMLGTKAIYMSEESQLGPLDLPMEHPADGSPISALDVVQALTSLESTSIEIAAETYKVLRNGDLGERIGKEKAIELSLIHAEKMVLPLLNKVDPYHRQRALRKLKIGRWYAIDLLLSSMMPLNHERANSAASKFVTMFPDHSYSIFREDARMCSLEIRDSESLSIWENVLLETDKLIDSKTPKIVYNEIEV